MAQHRVLWLVVVLFIIGLSSALLITLVFDGSTKSEEINGKNTSVARVNSPDTKNRFGFLAFPDRDGKQVRRTGARWVRPHPGPFIWGQMQSGAQAPIRFRDTDKVVRAAQKQKLSLLITLWPYASWDQSSYKKSKGCRIRDEFRSELDEFRCAPYKRKAYRRWVQAVIERYDGDGQSDMKGLRTAVRYWEASNEPDLKGHGLQFFVGKPSEYVNLLADTYRAAKLANNKTKVLIAGAAGGQRDFIAFWRRVFSIKRSKKYFDIANVHCISSGDYASLNVAPYKYLLQEKKINKQIWVTEAETFVSEDAAISATQLLESSRKAFDLGAKRIFYTGLNFMTPPGGKPPPVEKAPDIKPDPSLTVDDPIATYKQIFESLGS